MAYSLVTKDVVEMAEELIRHPHLLKARISYLFRDREWTGSGGKVILGKAAARDEIDKLLSKNSEDFIILIARPTWDDMDEEKRRALLDHELSHTIEEFPEVLARYAFKRRELGELIENPPKSVVVREGGRLIRRTARRAEEE